MTPKKELYLKIRDAIKEIEALEFVDLHRNQFGAGKESYPEYMTACLIKITAIQWQTMVEQLQEGTANIELTLYTLDGFAAQHATTEDAEDGLAEIELIDEIAETVQFLHGNSFQPLQQISEEAEETELEGIIAYKLTFSTMVYRKTAARYSRVANPLKAI